MIKAVPSMNNVFFTPEIKPDSANSSLQYLEAYKSPTGYFVFQQKKVYSFQV
jgi:hypothetical protein